MAVSQGCIPCWVCNQRRQKYRTPHPHIIMQYIVHDASYDPRKADLLQLQTLCFNILYFYVYIFIFVIVEQCKKFYMEKQEVSSRFKVFFKYKNIHNITSINIQGTTGLENDHLSLTDSVWISEHENLKPIKGIINDYRQ